MNNRKQVFITAIAIFILVTLFLMFGNPYGYLMSYRHAKRLIHTEHPDEGYSVKDVSYESGNTRYRALIGSDDNVDITFTAYFTAFGKYSYDTYESDVLEKYNIAYRLSNEYCEYMDPYLNQDESYYYQYAGLEIHPKDLIDDYYPGYSIEQESLENGYYYDMYELGKIAGKIYLTMEFGDDDMTAENLCAYLRTIKNDLDDSGVSFKAVDLYAYGNIGDYYTNFTIEDFMYEDIGSDDMLSIMLEKMGQ